MKEIDQEWIEAYLAGELTDKQRAILESRMAEDAVLRQEVEDYKLSIQALRLKRREELKERFKNRDQVNAKVFPWKLIVLAILLICVLFWVWNNQNGSPPILHEVEQLSDSTSIREDLNVPADTLKNIPNPTENEAKKIIPAPVKKLKPSANKLKQQPIAANGYTHEELFAMNFKPYKDETMNLNLRGNEPLSAYDQFIKFYWDGKYQEVILSFNQLNTALQNNDNVLFIKSNALMYNGEIDQAKQLLESIIRRNRTRYSIEARWNLGLCYLRTNDLTKAKEQFRVVKSFDQTRYKMSVEKLLRQF
ncbi:MAG: tetratricopeptide repeat protein [Saprospiraceae bacterium]|nr:tetratricopeptide repeat protein [Candidatus Vicinibacter proximus]